MSDGENTKFKRDPAAYARERTILVPAQDTVGFWSTVQPGPFDLAGVDGSGFDGTVVILSHMNRREKAQTKDTNPIAGIWVPYEPDQVVKREITATTSPYFLFTSKLGGCALGMKDARQATTTFFHDATGNQGANLAQAAVSLSPASYDPKDTGKNVTAFFWWNGAQWQVAQSATYNAHGLMQTIGNEKYPKKLG